MSVARDRPGITLVDVDAWVRSSPDPFDPARRDGVHILDEGSRLAGEWLIPQLLAVATGKVSPGSGGA